LVAREPGRGVASGRGRAAAHLVALPIGLALAVVGRADDDGAVDVAVEEGDDDLLPQAGDERAAPVLAGPVLGHADPGARGLGGGGVAVACGVAQAVAALGAALPVELHPDAAVAVGVNGLASADHDGGLGALHQGLVQGDAAMCVGGQAAHRHAQALGRQACFVKGLFAVVVPLAFELEVVARGVPDGQHGEGGRFGAFAQRVLGVVEQGEGGAGCQGAHGATAFEQLAGGLKGDGPGRLVTACS
jgi:hypothetical protein